MQTAFVQIGPEQEQAWGNQPQRPLRSSDLQRALLWSPESRCVACLTVLIGCGIT